MKEIHRKYHQWLESILAKTLPNEIEGFAINLYDSAETYNVELVGTPTFNASDEDWACDDIYMSEKFEFPISSLPKGWEPAQEEIAESTKQFMRSETKGAKKLNCAKGVGIGFVDGNLILIQANA